MRESLARVFRQQAPNQPPHRHRQQRIDLRGIGRLVRDDGRERLHRGVAPERMRRGRHLVQHHAERELIGPEVRFAAARLLWTHVRHRADDEAGCRLGVRGCSHQRFFIVLGFRQPEVDDLHASIDGDHHVLGLQIAMHDAGVVRCGQALSDLVGDLDHALERHPAAVHLRAQRAPFDELRHEIRGVAFDADVVHRQDVRMVQGAGRDGFLSEAALPIGVERRGFEQDLDRDIALESGVSRAVDLSHAAGAKPADDLVRPKTSGRSDIRSDLAAIVQKIRRGASVVNAMGRGR